MKIRNRFGLLLAFIMTIVSIPVGFSAWSTISNTFSEAITIPTSNKQVAYYDSKYFPTIESAVASANAVGNKTVYVIPGTNPTITQSFTINSNVTLIMPYDGKTYQGPEEKTEQAHITPYNFENEEYVKNKVFVSGGVSITVNGKFIVGGKIAYGSNTGITGFIGGNHTKLILLESADPLTPTTINVNGQLTCYGRILRETVGDTTSRINAYNGTILSPILLYDWPGAGEGKKRVEANIMPFSNYDVPNITIPMLINYPSSFVAEVWMEEFLYIKEPIYIISNNDNSLVKTKEGSVIYFEYKTTHENQLTTLSSAGHSSIIQICDGEADISYIQLSKTVPVIGQGITVDTQKFAISIPSSFTLIVGNGVNQVISSCKYSACFYGDSSIIVKENAQLSLDCSSNDLCTYKGIIMFDNVTIQNYGTVNIGGPTGLKIVSKSANAKLNVLSSISVVELTNTYLAAGSKRTPKDTENFLRGDLINDSGTVETNYHFVSAGSYESIERSGAYYWKKSSVIVVANVELKLGVSQSDSNQAVTSTATANLTPTDASDISEYTIFEWSVQENKGVYLSATEADAANSNSIRLTTYKSAENPNPNVIYFHALANDQRGPDSNTYHTITASISVTVKKSADDPGKKDSVIFTRLGRKGSSICFASGTLVTLADGSQKPVKQLQADDSIMVFDHFTGEYKAGDILGLVHHKEDVSKRIELRFDDGTSIDVVNAHSFFVVDDMEGYVTINEKTIDRYIGKTFAKIDQNSTLNYKPVKLLSYSVSTEMIDSWTLCTDGYISSYINGLLNSPYGVLDDVGDNAIINNFFDYDLDMSYNQEKMEQDIQLYGLYTYEEWADIMPEKYFYGLGVPYFKPSFSKGKGTKEDLIRYWNTFLENKENGEVII